MHYFCFMHLCLKHASQNNIVLNWIAAGNNYKHDRHRVLHTNEGEWSPPSTAGSCGIQGTSCRGFPDWADIYRKPSRDIPDWEEWRCEGDHQTEWEEIEEEAPRSVSEPVQSRLLAKLEGSGHLEWSCPSWPRRDHVACSTRLRSIYTYCMPFILQFC